MTFARAQRMTTKWFAGWTLRARLLAALIALLALICIIVGVVTQIVARNYLIAQVDNDLLHDVSHNVTSQAGPPDQGGWPTFLDRPGLPTGTVGAAFRAGAVDRAGVMSGFEPVRISDRATAVLKKVRIDNHQHTVTLPGLPSEYRAMALPTPSGKVVMALPLATVNNSLLRLGITELCVTIAGLIAVGLVGETIIRRTLRPLNRVAAIATRVSEMELGRGEVALRMRVPPQDTDPRTEIGQVGASLNRMLGHVSNALAFRQASEVRVRQFVADASHELRTPLAAIRGYAELTRRVGDGTVSNDVAYAMGRVESESARMTTLVEDLLLLARIDDGRPLDVNPVDLSILVVDVVSDAHVAGVDHEWSLDLPDIAVVIDGDGPRLHQVLANLLTNARVHTPAGTKVTVTLAASADGGATITVVDDGPGIPESLVPEVFERFARGDSSRSRAAGSTGLGLAIVAAVVEAHGGTVALASQPGETAFTVILPPAPPADADPPAASVTPIPEMPAQPHPEPPSADHELTP